MKVLITSASRKITLVNCFKKALKAEGGGEVWAADIDLTSPALLIADQGVLIPSTDSSDFESTLLNLCKREKIDLIIPTRDEELPILSNLSNKFNKIDTKIMVARLHTINICQNKLKFIDFCLQHGFGIAKLYSVSDVENNKINYPFFVRDVRGKASKSAFRVNNKEEWGLTKQLVVNPVIQEYLDFPEFTIDLFSDWKGNILSIVPRERILIYGGESFKAKTVKFPALIEESIRLSKQLKLIGHNTLQCFFDGRKIYWIEVNPRFGGGMDLGIAAGADTPRLLIKLIKGEKLIPKIGDYIDNLYMLRYTENVFINASELTKKYKDND